MTAVVIVLAILGAFVAAAVIMTIRHNHQTTQQNAAGMNRAYQPTHRR